MTGRVALPERRGGCTQVDRDRFGEVRDRHRHRSEIDVASNAGSSTVTTIRSLTAPADRAGTAAVDFGTMRSRLFGVAYRVLGVAADAEDVVQDVWIRWQGADRAAVQDGLAFLVTVTTRVALNAANSARSRREFTVGVGFRTATGQLPTRRRGRSVVRRSSGRCIS
jgi:hypothetical protein